jgi:protease-4
MTDPQTPNWERSVLEKVALRALDEQRRARQWNALFRLAWFGLTLLVFAAIMGWIGKPDKEGVAAASGRHTALVELEGVIAPGGKASAERMIKALDRAFKDTGTQGVVLRINSPGGSPVQAQTIYDEMRRLRRKYPDIPLYAVVEDICASGGYFVAAGADRIYVAKSSLVGSIGVLMNGFGFTGLMDKLGIERRLITSGENKGMLDPFSPLSDQHRGYAQAMLDEIHQQFIKVVRDGRGKRLKETPETFSGLFWSGEDAVKLGLADRFGNLDYVAREVVKAEEVIDYTPKENVAEKLAKKFGASIGAGAVHALRSLPALR